MSNEKLSHGNHPEGDAVIWTWVLYGIVVFLALVGVFIAFAGYFFLGFVLVGALPIIVYLLNFMIKGWMNNPKEYTLAERGGFFWKILGPGLHSIAFLLDSVRPDPFEQLSPNVTLTTRRRKMYMLTKGAKENEEIMREVQDHLNFEIAKVDYKDISGVDTSIVFFGGIGKEDDDYPQEELYADFYNFVYRYKDVRTRIALIAEAYIRPILQNMTLSEARLVGKGLWDKESPEPNAKENFLRDLKEVGFYPEENPFVLQDIVEPPEVVKARSDAFAREEEGKGEAARFENDFLGPVRKILELNTDSKEEITPKEATAIFFKDKSIKTLGTMSENTNLTLFLGNDDISKVIDVSKSREDKNN